ncbi:MAG TPA: hypothetical protein VGZ47_06225 [Gemmataceae bacterium]|nr:hypothetical protein [Gemmataceae bacterium]
MKIRFACPNCEAPQEVENPTAANWNCSACGQSRPLSLPDRADDKRIERCVACANHQLYRQKNFPQWLGITILAAACASFFILQGLYLPKPAWIVLLGSALFDGIMYLLVGDVIVCYRCLAKHYGLPRSHNYDPFELAVAEKYRQERLRRELALKK